ncbi:glycosyltransferase-like domain-containing protein 1 isoform X1 [Strongylocentrotus purpuratus]|uniref:tRNA-queuosine alpha-mannosyltransferase n=2 Tax=Strongylocentrotus purpuratus TaxID=7668 RepID=A0A7M7P4Y2_STRPU|nr:glycosyltransferase-like domain-containing protein 1 isoform X1 [Strongylocentrotus purpuratus]
MSEVSEGPACRGVLLLEPFYGGSHRQLIDLLHKSIPECTLFTLPASKWHWRARTSALYFSCQIPYDHSFSVLFASSVLNLAELVALRPDLAGFRKVLYFHENQLVYPVQKQQERDFQYGYNQILSCLVADAVVFNSSYNQESFLKSIESFLKLMPNRPKNLAERIRPKCQVLYFPIDFPPTLHNASPEPDRTAPLGQSSEMTPSHNAHQRYSAGHTPARSTKSPDHYCQGHVGLSSSADNATFVEDRHSSVQSGPRIISAESSHIEDRELNERLVTKVEGISLNDQQDNRVSSLHSVEVSEGGRSSQDSKEMELASRVHKMNTEDPANFVEEEHGNKSIISDTLPLSRTFVEQNASVCQRIAKVTPSLVNPQGDGGSCCHGSTCHRRADDCGDKDGKDIGSRTRPLHILWPHRWEHDKNPEQFFSTLFQLRDQDCNFRLSVLGENYLQIPSIFEEAEFKLKDHIVNWGFVPSKERYYQVLSEADVVVSTANHEFFGVAMLEATHYQCYPLCPERLVYPEIFPAEHLYRTPTQLLKKLRRFCRNPQLIRCYEFQGDLTKYSWRNLEAKYLKLLFGT